MNERTAQRDMSQLVTLSHVSPGRSPVSWEAVSGRHVRSVPSRQRDSQEAAAQAGEGLQAGPHLHSGGEGSRSQGGLELHPTQNLPARGQVGVGEATANVFASRFDHAGLRHSRLPVSFRSGYPDSTYLPRLAKVLTSHGIEEQQANLKY